MIELSSTHSMQTSLESICSGHGGLDAHRQALLNRVPETTSWAKFPHDHLTMRDLAYLTAKTGDEFAILRGKNEDILFHGGRMSCSFDDVLVDLLMSKRLTIFGHSHPGEDLPIPSPQDRTTLKAIGQKTSRLISGMTGKEIIYSDNAFTDYTL